MMVHSMSTQTRAVEGRQSGGVTLSAKAVVEPVEIVVSYTVVNETEQAIILWDRMIDYDAEGKKIDAEGAYVFWEEPDGVRLVRAQLQLPPGVDVYEKEIPYARTVAPHASVEGHIRLPLPLHEASPFYSPPEFWNVVQCRKARLLIGWRELGPGMKVVETTVRGVKVHSVQGRWQAPVQRLLETSMDISAALKTRREEFDRSLPMH